MNNEIENSMNTDRTPWDEDEAWARRALADGTARKCATCGEVTDEFFDCKDCHRAWCEVCWVYACDYEEPGSYYCTECGEARFDQEETKDA